MLNDWIILAFFSFFPSLQHQPSGGGFRETQLKVGSHPEMSGTSKAFFPWPAQLLDSTNCLDCYIVFNSTLRFKFLCRLIRSNWGSLEGRVSEVSVCYLFWPQEDVSQMSYSWVLFCKLAGLRSRLYGQYLHRSSTCLSPQLSLFLRIPLEFNLSTLIWGIKSNLLGRHLVACVLAFFSWGKIIWVRILEPGMGTMAVFSEWHSGSGSRVCEGVRGGKRVRVGCMQRLASLGWKYHHLMSWAE